MGKNLRMFAHYFFQSGNFKKIGLASLVNLAVTVCKTITPIFVTTLIEYFKKPSGDNSSSVVPFGNPLVVYSVVPIGLIFGTVLLPRISNVLISQVRRDSEKQITLDMVRSIYYERELDTLLSAPSGAVAILVNKNYGSIGPIVPALFSNIMSIISETLGISFALCFNYGEIGVLPVVTLGAYLVAAFFREKRSTEIKEQNSLLMRETFGALLYAVNSYQIAHQFGNTEYELNRLEKALSRMDFSFNRVNGEGEKSSLLFSSIAAAGSIATMVCAFLRQRGSRVLLLRDFILIAYYMLRFNSILDGLPPEIGVLYQGWLDAKIIGAFLSEKPKIIEPQVPLVFNLTEAPRIEFRSVSFAYASDKQNLCDISFVVEPGQKVAIMGPTGSGKTTILKLIQRFYDYQGQILINGADIKLLLTKDLRKYISVVSQETGLMGDTVFKNIGYGDLQAGEREVFAVAKRAGLSFERNRFFSSIQQQGADFSGGERQRISIARSLLKKSVYIFLLDEPTSALDQETSLKILESLDRETSCATTLVVTHDHNVAINADYILYLDQGMVVERGTFHELVGLRGAFYRQILARCEKLGIRVEDIKPINRQIHATAQVPRCSLMAGAQSSFFDRRRPTTELVEIGETSSIPALPATS